MELEEIIRDKLDNIFTSVLVDKLEVLEPDNRYPPIMTQSQAREWLVISDSTLKYYISKGMPVIKNESGNIRIPRDAVKDWFRNNWKDIA